MGNVLEVRAREGDSVQAGQLLARVDDRTYSADRARAEQGVTEAKQGLEEAQRGLAAAEAQHQLARVTFQRFEQLAEQKSISRQEFDEVRARRDGAEAGVGAARARLEQAKAKLGQAEAAFAAAETLFANTRVVSPVSGRVIARHIDPGSLATPGLPLFTVEDTSRYRFDTRLDENALAVVRVGQKAEVALDHLAPEVIAGKITQVVPAIDPSSRTFQVKIALPRHPRVRSGQFGRARFQRGQRQAILVPASAIVERGQLRGVYAQEPDGVLHLRLITAGSRKDDRVEVLSGLAAGDTIVANPGDRNLEGKRAEVNP
jgi:RND family efflux transporter MFP subunit